MANQTHTGDELFNRIKDIQDKEKGVALDTVRKLRNGETVSDGELLDALYTFSVNLDIASPLLPVCYETLKRFMVYSGISETPRGIQRTWLDACSNPNCIEGKVSVGCSVDNPLLVSDCPDCTRAKAL